MARVIRTDQAEADLVEILTYLRGHNPRAADRFEVAFGEKCRLLVQFPLMGPSREDFALSLRSTIVSPYVIFYRPIDQGILILRVVHASRDTSKLFE